MNKKFFSEHKPLTGFLTIVALVLIYNFWHICIPLIITIFIYKTNKLDQTKKKVGYALMLVLVIMLSFAYYHIASYNNRPPTLTITSPENNLTMQGKQIVIKGTVDPSNSEIAINGDKINADNNGTFVYIFQTPKETNTVNIVATHGSKTDIKTLTVNRQFTDQEKADIAKAQAQAKAVEQEYQNSPAGKLCAKHTDWSKEDCNSVASKEIWIGMTYDMLIAERGIPEHANQSNYGRGIKWQWCWFDFTPSCFYGGNDGIITSYN